MKICCSICTLPIPEQHFDQGLVADHFAYDFEGELDFIELAHQPCALVDSQTSPGFWTHGPSA